MKTLVTILAVAILGLATGSDKPKQAPKSVLPAPNQNTTVGEQPVLLDCNQTPNLSALVKRISDQRIVILRVCLAAEVIDPLDVVEVPPSTDPQ